VSPNPNLPARRTQTGRMSRRVDVSAIVDLLLLLPELLSSLLVMALLGGFLMPQLPWLIAVLWLASGALIFLPAAERLFAQLKFRVRQPSQAELSSLAQPWISVCQAAGVPHGRYSLWIEESDGVNALAAGGHVVAMTQSALRLSPAQLEAILAHELGHHLSGHAWVSQLGWYYSVPARMSVRLAALLLRASDSVGRLFRRFGFVFAELTFALCSLFLVIALISLNPWLLLVPVTSLLMAWSSRLAETRADRIAAQLGYGQELIGVLQMWNQHQGSGRPRGRRALLATHPSHQARIRKLIGYVNRP
jgi:Zn-dependent protease with chaperone function